MRLNGDMNLMKKIMLKHTYILSFCFLFACNVNINRSPMVEKIESIKGTLTIKDVKKRFGEPKQGNRSSIWYKSGPREVWFWFLAKEDVNPDNFLIAFITLVYPDNPEMTKIIWPDKLKHYIHKDLTKSIESANQPKATQEKKPIDDKD